MGMGIGYDGSGMGMNYDGNMGMFAQDMGFDVNVGMDMGQYQPTLEHTFEHHGGSLVHDSSMMAYGFEFNDMVHE